MKLFISPAPHIHAKADVRSIMRDVLIALVPAAGYGIYAFGINAGLIIAVCVASCVICEVLCQRLMRRKITISDLSAVVTGVILALNLPPTVPLWIPAIGGAFAILIVKQVYGGIGNNVLNPALAARAVLLISWPQYLTASAYVFPTYFYNMDAFSGATPLAGYNAPLSELFFGNIPGTIGEICKAAILLGLAYLLIRKVVSWRIPVLFILSSALFIWLFGAKGQGAFSGDVLASLLSGGLIFGAVFMATDYATSPITAKGQMLYAIFGGFLLAILRRFTTNPESVTYTILIMNIITPLIDKYVKNRLYGFSGKKSKAAAA